MKAKILVVIDVPGWALDRTARNVISRLSKEYDFTIVYNKGLMEQLKSNKFDLYYLCYFRQLEDARLELKLPKPKVTGVRSHFKWDDGQGKEPDEKLVESLRQYGAINVPSKILFHIFSPYLSSLFHTPHGVDCSLFEPSRQRRNNAGRKKLLVGWAGSSSNHPGKRGLDDFLIPSLNGLSNVDLEMACREHQWRTQEEMVEYYQRLDLYLCTSRTEGGPHPLLEASACGVPIISTKVGHAPELIEQGVNGFLTERDVQSIRHHVVKLRDDPDLRYEMGKKARMTVERDWHWDNQAPKYVPFFEAALKER